MAFWLHIFDPRGHVWVMMVLCGLALFYSACAYLKCSTAHQFHAFVSLAEWKALSQVGSYNDASLGWPRSNLVGQAAVHFTSCHCSLAYVILQGEA